MTYSIRLGTFHDMKSILDLIKEFHETTLYHSKFKESVNLNQAQELSAICINATDVACLFVAERSDGKIIGLIAGLLIPNMCLGGKLVSSEPMWYVTDKERKTGAGIALLHKYIDWVKTKGINYVSVDCMDDSVGSVLSGLGYTLMERKYIKAV